MAAGRDRLDHLQDRMPVLSLREWVRQAERDQDKRTGLTSTEREHIKQLEGEKLKLKRSNEIPRKAVAFFVQAKLVR
ncbi:MAG: hypothetical protein KF868_13915 [Acidobacteria bacterium]|nr:hypothetical protein [Acidobacteriota bacterium]